MRPFLTLHHPEAARAYYKLGLWQTDTFYGLLRKNAEATPLDIALRDSSQSLTWTDLLQWVDGIAADLRSFDLTQGDRVCGWMSNRAEMLATMLACSREGFAFNPSLHRSHTCQDVGKLIGQLATKALIMEAGWGADSDSAKLTAILAGIPSLKVVYDVDTFPTARPNLTEWNRDPDKIVYLAYTSGTTGDPKCVMHSENTLLANARQMVRAWNHDRETCIYSVSPLSHHIAWVGFSQWLLTGCQFVVNEPPAGKTTLDWIKETGATYVMGVPTQAIDLLEENARRGIGFGRVKTFYLAGATVPPDLCRRLMATGITPQNVYGMTENSSHRYTLPTDTMEIIANTCGRGDEAYETRIFDKDDSARELPPGDIGQIGGRGAVQMLGYFNNQTSTENSFNENGWFLSGDLGVIDEHGHLTIVGRLKDTIIRGGHNIYPNHIEDLVLQHPDVIQAACIPFPDTRLGERVCLVITGKAEQENIMQFLRDKGLSKYDTPELFLTIQEFPLTSSGKILKRGLVDMIRRAKIKPQWVNKPSQAEYNTA